MSKLALAAGRGFSHLFAQRFRLVGLVLGAYLIINSGVRLGLLIFNADWALLAPNYSVPIFGIGLLFDLAAACWWLPIFALVAAFWPSGLRSRPSFLIVGGALLATTFGTLAFVGVSEFVFWNEFASRFNFIAVDYLIYTREVIGNIRESYDLRPLLAGIFFIALAGLAICWRGLKRAAAPSDMPWRGRLARLLAFLLLSPPTWIVWQAKACCLPASTPRGRAPYAGLKR